jgi:hypothetical protein
MPTPTRLSAKDLVPGGSYLHHNGLFVRHIDWVGAERARFWTQVLRRL